LIFTAFYFYVLYLLDFKASLASDRVKNMTQMVNLEHTT